MNSFAVPFHQAPEKCRSFTLLANLFRKCTGVLKIVNSF